MSVLRELKRKVRRCEPCLPRPAKEPPAGPGWIHEIKHDGFRIIARREATGVRLITRNGYDLAARFPLAAAAIAALPARSCVVDGEAIAVDDNGLSVFDLIRYRRQDHAVTLCAFDLIELDGEDLRREPIEVRKRTLKGLLREPIRASLSTGISTPKARSCSSRPARSDARALCRSALARPIAPAAPIVG
jgi:ATP-dependent DNA ligase